MRLAQSAWFDILSKAPPPSVHSRSKAYVPAPHQNALPATPKLHRAMHTPCTVAAAQPRCSTPPAAWDRAWDRRPLLGYCGPVAHNQPAGMRHASGAQAQSLLQHGICRAAAVSVYWPRPSGSSWRPHLGVSTAPWQRSSPPTLPLRSKSGRWPQRWAPRWTPMSSWIRPASPRDIILTLTISPSEPAPPPHPLKAPKGRGHDCYSSKKDMVRAALAIFLVHLMSLNPPFALQTPHVPP